MTIDKPGRRRRWPWIVLGIVAVLGILAVVENLAEQAREEQSVPSAPTINTDDMAGQPPQVMTYLFYWYDSETGGHLQEESGLPTHLPADPPPKIGLFFDSTILDGRDLTSIEGKDAFYGLIRAYFERFPSDQWALVDGKPVISMFFSFFATAFDQSTFDYVYDSFERDFGVRPYIIREQTWSFAVTDLGGRRALEDQPIATEASYKWGAALDGYSDVGNVSSVGPGFDEHLIPNRGNAIRDRADGAWYRENFEKAIASGKRLLVIETWNEVHEASGIGETLEYGREYLNLTRELSAKYKETVGAGQ